MIHHSASCASTSVFSNLLKAKKWPHLWGRITNQMLYPFELRPEVPEQGRCHRVPVRRVQDLSSQLHSAHSFGTQKKTAGGAARFGRGFDP